MFQNLNSQDSSFLDFSDKYPFDISALMVWDCVLSVQFFGCLDITFLADELITNSIRDLIAMIFAKPKVAYTI